MIESKKVSVEEAQQWLLDGRLRLHLKQAGAVASLLDQLTDRIAELESQLTKALTPRCTYCLCAPCECALREAGPTGYES